MRRICITGNGFDKLFGIQTTYFHFLKSQRTINILSEQFFSEVSAYLDLNQEVSFKSKVKGLEKISNKARYTKLRDTNLLLLYLIMYKKTYRGWAELEYKLTGIHIHLLSLYRKNEKISNNFQPFTISKDDCLIFLKPQFFSNNSFTELSTAFIQETFQFRKLFSTYIDLVELRVDRIVHSQRLKQQFKRELRSLFFMSDEVDEKMYKQTEIINFNSSNYFTKYLYSSKNFIELSHRYVISLRDDNIEEKIFHSASLYSNHSEKIFSDFEKYTKIIEGMHLKRITKIQHIARIVASLHFYVFDFNKYDYRYFFEVFEHCRLLESDVTIHFYYQGDRSAKELKKEEVSALIAEYCEISETSQLNGHAAIQKLRREKRIRLHRLDQNFINIEQEFIKHQQKGTFDLSKR